MKVLVTGSNGQVGNCLVHQLEKTNWQVRTFDKADLDITDYEKVLKAVNDFKPDIIINAAAYTQVDKAETEVGRAYAINREGPKFLAQASKAVGSVFFHISTDYVFSGDKKETYCEEDSTNPQGIYGESKLAGELAVMGSCEKYIILRTAWVFGEHGNNFVKTMLRLGHSKNKLSIVGDQFGGPTYSGDIAKALVRMAKILESDNKLDWGIYHYSGYPHISWYDFAEAIFNKAKENKILANSPDLTAISTSEYPTPAKRPANSRLNCRKIEKNMGITPSDWLMAINNIKAYSGNK